MRSFESHVEPTSVVQVYLLAALTFADGPPCYVADTSWTLRNPITRLAPPHHPGRGNCRSDRFSLRAPLTPLQEGIPISCKTSDTRT